MASLTNEAQEEGGTDLRSPSERCEHSPSLFLETHRVYRKGLPDWLTVKDVSANAQPLTSPQIIWENDGI